MSLLHAPPGHRSRKDKSRPDFGLGEEEWGRERFKPAFERDVRKFKPSNSAHPDVHECVRTVEAMDCEGLQCVLEQLERSAKSRTIGPGTRIISLEAAEELFRIVRNSGQSGNAAKITFRELPTVE